MFRAARGYRYSVAVPSFGPRECFERRGTGAQGPSPVAKVHADGVASWQRPLRLASPEFAVTGAAEHETGAIFAGCWEVQQSGWPPQARMRLRNASAMRVNIKRSEWMRTGKDLRNCLNLASWQSCVTSGASTRPEPLRVPRGGGPPTRSMGIFFSSQVGPGRRASKKAGAS